MNQFTWESVLNEVELIQIALNQFLIEFDSFNPIENATFLMSKFIRYLTYGGSPTHIMT